MEDLARSRCVPCTQRAAPATEGQIDSFLREYGGWRLVRGEEPRLIREYHFPDFAAAFDFTQRIAALAEEENHHPEIVTAWGKVIVSWWTHKIRGIHHNDLIMAARTEKVYREKPGAG